jgi:Protein of unknown function (DUF3237)
LFTLVVALVLDPAAVLLLLAARRRGAHDGEISTAIAAPLEDSYNGIRQCPKESNERFLKGELIKSEDCYFLTAPTFETKSEKYGWLNGVQAVGKMTEHKRADHVAYDIFALK